VKFPIFAAMKLVAFIMAFMVLGLSCLQCADKAVADHKVERHTHERDSHEDACSPFCHCTCCAGFSINYFTASVSGYISFETRTFSDHLPTNTREVSLPVWQPPQLS
jgi:hypothetical protein